MVRVIERQDRGKNCPAAIFTPWQPDVSLGPLGRYSLVALQERHPALQDREVWHGVGADRVGVKFPMFAVNCSRFPLSSERIRQKRRKTKKKRRKTKKSEEKRRKAKKNKQKKGKSEEKREKKENSSDPIYTNPIKNLPTKARNVTQNQTCIAHKSLIQELLSLRIVALGSKAQKHTLELHART